MEYSERGHAVPHLTMLGRIDCFNSEQFDERLEVRKDPYPWVRLFEQYQIAGRMDMSMMILPEVVDNVSQLEPRSETPVELFENLRAGETMIKQCGVDISTANTALGWKPAESIRDSVQRLIRIDSSDESVQE